MMNSGGQKKKNEHGIHKRDKSFWIGNEIMNMFESNLIAPSILVSLHWANDLFASITKDIHLQKQWLERCWSLPHCLFCCFVQKNLRTPTRTARSSHATDTLRLSTCETGRGRKHQLSTLNEQAKIKKPQTTKQTSTSCKKKKKRNTITPESKTMVSVRWPTDQKPATTVTK